MLTVDAETFERLVAIIGSPSVVREALSELGLQAPELPTTKGGDAMQPVQLKPEPNFESAGGLVGTDSPPYETAPRLTKEVPPKMPSAQGERCTLCGADAHCKVEEADVNVGKDLFDCRHPYTAYVCAECFSRIMFPHLHRVVRVEPEKADH